MSPIRALKALLAGQLLALAAAVVQPILPSNYDTLPITGPAPLYLQAPLTQIDPLAMCADGSPAAFYFKPSNKNGSSNVWIIYLDGGYQWRALPDEPEPCMYRIAVLKEPCTNELSDCSKLVHRGPNINYFITFGSNSTINGRVST